MIETMGKWAVFACILSFASMALGQDATTNHCAEDQKKLCSRFEGLAILKCLVDNYDDLSADCKTQMEPVRVRVMDQEKEASSLTGMLDTCKDDVGKLCPKLRRQPIRAKACLEEHTDKLSAECKAALKESATPGNP